MAPKAARVDSGPSIRSVSKSKQRPSAQSGRKSVGSELYGSLPGASLASSLSTLFPSKPHGKDAALASLLASSSKKSTDAKPLDGFHPFGSLAQANVAPQFKSVADLTASSTKALEPTLTPLETRQRDTKKAKLASHDTRPISKKPNKQGESASVQPEQIVIPHVPTGRKPVFRPVLASSTMVSWSELPAAGSQIVLHTLLDVLTSDQLKQTVRNDLGRKRKGTDTDDKTARSPEAASRPSVLAGVNSITRQLEEEVDKIIRSGLNYQDKGKGKEGVDAFDTRIVFVCRQDGSPISLFAHLPMLTCTVNAVRSVSSAAKDLVLFPLPSGSEALLARAVGVRHCSAFALTSHFPREQLDTILAAVKQQTGTVGQLQAPWLTTAIHTAAKAASHSDDTPAQLFLEPAKIKFLRTTQPSDLNACKALKKSKRKLRASRWKARKSKLQHQLKQINKEAKKQAKASSRLRQQQAAAKVSHTPT